MGNGQNPPGHDPQTKSPGQNLLDRHKTKKIPPDNPTGQNPPPKGQGHMGFCVSCVRDIA